MDLGCRKGYFEERLLEHLLELDRLDDLVEGLYSKDDLGVDLCFEDGLVVDLSIHLDRFDLLVGHLMELQVEAPYSLDVQVVVLCFEDGLEEDLFLVHRLGHLDRVDLLASEPYLQSLRFVPLL